MKPNFNKNYKGIKCRVYLIRENDGDEVVAIHNPTAAYELVKDELVSSDREMLLSVMLTTKNNLIGVETVSIGSINVTSMSPREVFKSAILANAVSIILCHNHPSGCLIPSDADIQMTKQFVEAGELLGIKVLDHIVVSDQGFKSLRDCYKFPD
ncbi:MAG: JAB domain-containing protein [Bacteroidetes bacterium]|nr:JAB domain-containing protein [Bacteroidota bacterium]